MIYNSLSIAGTDPTGGAGIHADLKVFSALGNYGAAVITALVAQNTCVVQSIYNLPGEVVASQLESVLTDVKIDSVKIGMLSNTTNICVVAALQKYSLSFIVLDTVMLSKSGISLLDINAIDSFINILLPQVSLITPNLPEAAVLLKCAVARNEKEMISQGRKILSLGCPAVLMKGGHLNNKESPDWLVTESGEWRYSLPKVRTQHTHGTGCTLSAALAAQRPYFNNWHDTIIAAKDYVQNTLKHANRLCVGEGIGPVHHFYAWW
ncbi:Hydroxymethylpyrimidine/phosphomethylpyrimidine kinase [Arsenophonus endosymbiont of Aleurodicus dispersus]|uniref:bifunctional hydroxymethylpyrimidine kinase/phosphomethylpyrimidine kinase n=1 Tax=Arsenophonus endosymbiont of Aleurodicus dispersus TaxID=235559 RepID=UPI000EB0CE32|nr:bifunctional hydroxymethylpyrimidine kinase/phosphomethylpyrimidine kinase [Arsenophonus endosymbiont of Aleurodicus dispersus]VAY02300.1 Hydroxymethylpyrimidine/phosphomethylpyrimidine kinase [Arsenophonus endosymbiont of Aleurodicus dispersus]